MTSLYDDRPGDKRLTPQALTLLVYRTLATVSGLGALAVVLAHWNTLGIDALCRALWIGLSGWLGSLIFCETMIVVFIVAQSLQLVRRDMEGQQPFNMPARLLPDFSDMRAARAMQRSASR